MFGAKLTNLIGKLKNPQGEAGWFLDRHRELHLVTAYQELANAFPNGLADAQALPEEISGEVAAAAAKSL